MGITDDILQGKGYPPLTRADVLERLQQAQVAGTSLSLAGETLVGSDLSMLNLSGADLREADLREVDLHRARLSRADLSRADLHRADLHRVRFSGADLREADLSEADLSRANLIGADLNGANLIGADLNGANLNEANLSGANLNEANLVEADLNGANLSGANLSGANLSRADLSEANLAGMDLSKVKLNGAILQDVSIASNTSNINAETLTLQIRIEDGSFSSHHLAETIATFRSLLTRLWLLRQGRIKDFEHYTQKQDRNLENEVPLSIRFSVNSRTNIQFNFDWSPKGLVEAFHQLVDTFLLWKQRRCKGELDLVQQQRQIAEQSLFLAQYLVRAVAPNLTDGQKRAAIESVLKDIHTAAKDAALEISLLHPQLVKPQVTVTLSVPPSQRSTGYVE